ncbi:MAG: anthranilate synthase component I family protein [Planctomycetota bacterium]|nr:anthranilate synthase component I family protein [Planctomycetota bacterium]
MSNFKVRCIARSSAAVSPSSCLLEMPSSTPLVFLDSSSGRGLSAIAFEPDDAVVGRVSPAVSTSEKWPLSNIDPAQELERACQGENWSFDAGLPQIGVGWIGWFSFECGHAYESFPWNAPYPDSWPDYNFGRYRQALVWTPDGRAMLLYAFCDDLPDASADALVLFEDVIAKAECKQVDLAPQKQKLKAEKGAAYQDGVKQLRSLIAEGELFQANLSHEMSGKFKGNARELYVSLRGEQPTELSCYWEDQSGRSLISHSPESFLNVNGAEIVSRPIKGTAHREQDAQLDAEAAEQLNANEKEMAELNMIVDMTRNDLGRIATVGQVAVENAGSVVSYPTLHHREAIIRARWRPQTGLAKLIAATFPPASISGAPKVRALQAIAEIEQRSRGAYCGSLGYWVPSASPHGEFSVLIRTACIAKGTLRLAVGAGIVWDSDPQAEWEETLLKGRYLRDE